MLKAKRTPSKKISTPTKAMKTPKKKNKYVFVSKKSAMKKRNVAHLEEWLLKKNIMLML